MPSSSSSATGRGAGVRLDDFGDTDVSGKILLFLVNDPPLDDVFGGSAMTYYGRWTYKHEIAAELGAAGSLVIHETGPAGYPWEVVGSTPYAESFDLVAADDNLSRATFEGWVQRAHRRVAVRDGGARLRGGEAAGGRPRVRSRSRSA